jgi:hypothetical protein
MASKIPLTRLPFEVREELCSRIRDRQSWKQLNAWLAPQNFGPYKPQNFSAFKKSKNHYAAWLGEQHKLDERRSRSESIRRECEADGFSMVDRTMLDLVDKLSDPDLDPIKAASTLASLKSAVTAASKLEVEKRRVQIAQESAELDRDRFRFQVANQFLSWFDDKRAREIALSGADKSVKVQQLIDLMADMEKDEGR